MEDKDPRDDPDFWSEYYYEEPPKKFDREKECVCLFLLIALFWVIVFFYLM